MNTITSSSDANNVRTYDPTIIIKAAEDKLSSNDMAGGQTLFQSALLNWVDDARENVFGQDPEQMREAIATLWIAYAHYLRKAKQFKSATEAYEQAVECPVSGQVGRIWIDYARFLDDRGKQRTAQQVYLRALHDNQGGVVRDEQDRTLLWNEFLEMMRKRNPTLTLLELQNAIEEETKTSVNPYVEGDDSMYDDLQPPPETVSSSSAAAKRPRSNSASGEDQTESMADEQNPSIPLPRSHVVTASDIDTEKKLLQELTENAQNDPGFMATWMARDGNDAPQPPTPLFGCSPPKLSDSTGKDLLGEEMALQMIQTLLKPTGPIILQVCRGMWMLNGLKEHQAQKALAKLDQTIKDEIVVLQRRLDERLSVAGAAVSAVQQMNDSERQSFEANCNQQRQSLLNSIAWEQRQVLWCQQQILTKLKIPGFHGTTVDASELEFQARICSYLHSAFFVQKRIKQDAYVAMLKSQEERLKQSALKSKDDQPQKKKKKTRFSPALSGTARMTPPPPMPSYQQIQANQLPPSQLGGYMQHPPPPPPPQMMLQPSNMSGYSLPNQYPPSYHPPP